MEGANAAHQHRAREREQAVAISYRHLDINNNFGCTRKISMGKQKKVPLVIAGTVLGIVALLAMRKRRTENTESEPREAKKEGPETAIEHAKVAVEHTRQAAGKTKEELPRRTK